MSCGVTTARHPPVLPCIARHLMFIRYAVALAAVLFLAACGSGGGGSPTRTAPVDPSPPPSEASTRNTAFSSAAASNAPEEAATAPRLFGSVTQSSNRTDEAQVTLQGDHFFLRVRRCGKCDLTLNTRDHLVALGPTTISPVTGRGWSDGIVFDYDANSVTAVRGRSTTAIPIWATGWQEDTGCM